MYRQYLVSSTTYVNVCRAKGKTLFESKSSKGIESSKSTPAPFADVPKKNVISKRNDPTLTDMMTADEDPIFHRNLGTSPAFDYAKPIGDARKEMGVSEPKFPGDPERGNDQGNDEEKTA